MQETSHAAKLLAGALFALLAFSYPLLSLASNQYLLLGLPALYIYLFGTWLIFILFVRQVTSKQSGTPDSHDTRNKRA